MTYNPGDYVAVVDPTPYLDEGSYTDGLYFNDRMRVFIGRTFRIVKMDYDLTYKLGYIDTSDNLEKADDVISRWSWNKKWLVPADEFVSGDIDCDNLQDIMYMITW